MAMAAILCEYDVHGMSANTVVEKMASGIKSPYVPQDGIIQSKTQGVFRKSQ